MRRRIRLFLVAAVLGLVALLPGSSHAMTCARSPLGGDPCQTICQIVPGAAKLLTLCHLA